jgi:hypothetical protein
MQADYFARAIALAVRTRTPVAATWLGVVLIVTATSTPAALRQELASAPITKTPPKRGR